MLLSKSSLTDGISEWTKNQLGKCYRMVQQRQSVHTKRQQHSYYHHHHRIIEEATSTAAAAVASTTSMVSNGDNVIDQATLPLPPQPQQRPVCHATTPSISTIDACEMLMPMISTRGTMTTTITTTATASSSRNRTSAITTTTTTPTAWTTRTTLAIMAIFIASIHCQIGNATHDSPSYYYNNPNTNNNNTHSDSFSSVYSNSSNNTIILAVDENIDGGSNHFLTNLNKLRRQPIYQNEFALYIPKGDDVADQVATKFGFTNMGQVRFASLYN